MSSIRSLRRAFAALALPALLVVSSHALNPSLPPSGNFDLSHWKLTLPTGSSGNPDEILPAQMAAGYTNSPYFFTATTDGAMTFWTPVTGVTTSGSSYPRCELREQLSPGNDTPNWYGDGTHILDGQCKVLQVPSTGKVIIGQIHGKSYPGATDANPLVKLAYDSSSSSVRIQVKTSPNKADSTESVDVVSGIAVGTLITYQIKVIDGIVYNTVNGTTYARNFYATDPLWASTDLYFKAGSYCQDNVGSSSEGAKIAFYALTITHGAPTPPSITTTSLPSGRTTISYGTQQLAATGGTTPYAWSLSAGALPTGLSLAPSTGIISGTPSAAGTTNFTARVTDAASQTATQALAITIATNSVPNITTTTLPSATTGTAYSQSIASTGGDGALLWSVLSGSLPAGLSLSNTNSQNSTISGTPSTAGTSSVTLKLADVDADNDTQALSIVVNNPANTPPTITALANQTVNEDNATAALAFTVGDAQTAAASLTVSGASSNTTLVPTASIAFGGSGASRTVTVTPAANQNGTATITVTVTDGGGLTASSAFTLTVNAVNDAPTITAIANQTIAANGNTGALAFTVGDVETAAASLTVSGASSNTTLVPTASIVFGGSGASRTVTVTPAANQSGTATITVTVSDGTASTPTSFTLTVNAASDPEIVPTAAPDSTPWDTAGSNGPAQIYDGATADGGNGTRWASNASPGTLASAPRYVTLDLGAAKNITKFVVWPYQARAYAYKIYVSTDGVNFGSPVVNVQPSTGATSYTHTLGTAAVGRYVKLLVDGITGVSTTWASINEFDIFGTAAGNTPPTISDIANQTITAGGNTGALAFTIGDAETAAASLTVSRASSNTTLVPTANIVLGGSGSSRTVTVTPASGQTGTATITVTVTDGGGLTASDTFTLTVNTGGGVVPVLVEAESVSFDSNWVNIADAAAFSGHALQAQTSSNSSAPANGGLVYNFTLNSSSTIYLQTRSRSPNGTSSDSFWVRLDGGAWAQFVQNSTNTYSWSNKSYSSVASGAHTFEIRYREAQAVLDQVAITLNSTPPN